MENTSKPLVMVNGLSSNPERGKMALPTAEAIIESSDFALHPYSLCGESSTALEKAVGDRTVLLYPPRRREFFVKDSQSAGNPSFVVDYGTTASVLGNVEMYCNNGWDFIIGASVKKEDLPKIEEIVRQSKSRVLIGPNMALPIVGLQRILSKIEALQGYRLSVRESHQQSKEKPSATANAIIDYFVKARVPCERFEYKGETIRMDVIRDPEKQIALGVPKEFLGAHGYHWFNLEPQVLSDECNEDQLKTLNNNLSTFLLESPLFDHYSLEQDPRKPVDVSYIRRAPNNSAIFELRYNVWDSTLELNTKINGRRIYADGTLEALRFLQRQGDDARGKIFSMIDVLDALPNAA